MNSVPPHRRLNHPGPVGAPPTDCRTDRRSVVATEKNPTGAQALLFTPPSERRGKLPNNGRTPSARRFKISFDKEKGLQFVSGEIKFWARLSGNHVDGRLLVIKSWERSVPEETLAGLGAAIAESIIASYGESPLEIVYDKKTIFKSLGDSCRGLNLIV